MRATIIIPTHRRPEILTRCVEAVFEQSPELLSKTEIFIISDGQDEPTLQAIKALRDKAPCQVAFSMENKIGRAAVRNKAARFASGELLIFIGDDIIVTPGWLETHMHFHERNHQANMALVGHITWHPELPISPYMHWLEHGGPLLRFDGLHDGDQIDFRRFYTGNVSIKKEFFLSETFNESHDMYGWEDTELASRLTHKRHMKLFYSAKALAYHYHIYREDDLTVYSEKLGYSAVLFQQANPEFDILPGLLKRCVFGIVISLLPVWRRLNQEFYWYALHKRHFLLGMKSAYEFQRDHH